MKIGYVGLGNMGAALRKTASASVPAICLRHLNEAAVERMVEKGSTACSSPRDVASQSDVILLCLPTSDHVRAAIFGENGLGAALKPGTLIVDQTTGDDHRHPRHGRRSFGKRGVDLIDAPVSGGAQGADAGTIAIMVGAAPEQYARIHPILGAISANVFHAGGVGAGQVMKLVNNVLSGAQRLLTFEAVALATKNGIDPQRAVRHLVGRRCKEFFYREVVGAADHQRKSWGQASHSA